MPAVSGSFSGKVKVQTTLAVDDQSNHDLSIAEVIGTQKSSDEKWNNAAITYWGTTDIADGKGSQRGYFVNDHGADGRDWGAFEGEVAVAGSALTVQGTWQYAGGSGRFAGITGNGTFKTKLSSPGDVEATWQGAYELASTKGHGR